ncbi:hypothetical protein MPH_11649 [Macrophomina phaseolina MS6]|uniref:Uncharacterized protein n=1 Tax=Macrophomina phaseolina (strain MS6) TaxID=1126212 RepID=K2R9P0_MACPH|nr:hypothetical protein MPH_11649 [Macrophomina phaseolina MS6]
MPLPTQFVKFPSLHHTIISRECDATSIIAGKRVDCAAIAAIIRKWTEDALQRFRVAFSVTRPDFSNGRLEESCSLWTHDTITTKPSGTASATTLPAPTVLLTSRGSLITISSLALGTPLRTASSPFSVMCSLLNGLPCLRGLMGEVKRLGGDALSECIPRFGAVMAVDFAIHRVHGTCRLIFCMETSLMWVNRQESCEESQSALR